MFQRYRLLVCFGLCAAVAVAQSGPAPSGGFKPASAADSEKTGTDKAGTDKPNAGEYIIEPGTRILLNMINSISTRQAAIGDRVYLETAFPVLSNGKVVIPQGSWVQGTVTEVKRPGRIKGKGELYVRFDSLTLPNGISRDFRSRIATLDSRSGQKLDREEGKVTAQGNKAGDAAKVATAAGAGAGIGSIAGVSSGHTGMGAGIGGAAGAAAGLVGVLLTRGPDATLTKGSTMEMTLDRRLYFTDKDLDFSQAPRRAALAEGNQE